MTERGVTQIGILLGYAAPIRVLEPAEDGGPPKKLGPGIYDIDSELVSVAGGTAIVRKYVGPIAPPVGASIVELTVRTDRHGKLSESNIEHADLLISLIDHIEFSLQQAIRVLAFDAVDTTPDLAIGQNRESFIYSGDGSALGGRLLGRPADMRWSFFGTERISLRGSPDPRGKLALARWWYLKALTAPLAIDSYLGLWTALEVLSRVDGESVRSSLRLQCGHMLHECPTCSAATTREVNGLTMKSYLAKHGVGVDDADSMWRLRQAVHGKNLFTAKESDELERQLGVLRAIVFTIIKHKLGIGVNDLPAVASAGGPVISGWMGLGAQRTITSADVEFDQLLASGRVHP